MTLELTTKYSKLIDERFTLASVTEKFAGKRYDWDGAQSIKIYSVDPVAESDYNRTAGAGRFGTIAELGIGTNEAAKLCGIILEDEKLYGTVHIAFGTNTSFGGITKADCHLDGIILNPTLYLDDECVIRKGEFL